MGMDVYGKKPTRKSGTYFRNNCWWWRPLWSFCEQVAPELTAKVKYGQSNDGDGLKTQRDCTALAQAIEKAVEQKIEWVRPDDMDEHLYPFSYQNVKEFAVFLRSCGGFEIW